MSIPTFLKGGENMGREEESWGSSAAGRKLDSI
jgi:hypothetical protein